MKKITSLTLKNFKAYKEQSFDFSNLTVFCGNNSVGKSTAIQAIGMFLQSDMNGNSNLKINGDLVHVGDFDDIHNFSMREDDVLYLKYTFEDDTACWGYGIEEGDAREELSRKNELPFIGCDKQLRTITNSLKDNFSFQYLEAERFGPRDNIPLSQHNYHEGWLGKNGEHTIEVLESLVTRRRLNFSAQEDPRKHEGIINNNVFNHIEAWMSEISPGHRISPRIEARANVAFNVIIPSPGQLTKPINIGFGFSYALSIVTALMLASKNELVIIENPEAHLHPRGQSYLGRLIALSAKAGIQVIIETHSDHLLNGIRVIARTYPTFDASLFTLYYISRENDETSVAKIKINNEGKLSEWPRGFFDQQSQDMYTIMTGSFDHPNI
ncbi:TPA: DUF3696 domain-containing protein [Escherichia coli]|nr:DUF3696 domain-containing protein [Escherichia coli]